MSPCIAVVQIDDSITITFVTEDHGFMITYNVIVTCTYNNCCYELKVTKNNILLL